MTVNKQKQTEKLIKQDIKNMDCIRKQLITTLDIEWYERRMMKNRIRFKTQLQKILNSKSESCD